MLKFKLFFLKYRCIISYTLIILLFIALILKGGTLYLEKINEKIPKEISYVESSDIFSDSFPYVVKEGLDGEKEVTYKTDNNGIKSIYSIKVIKKSKEETQVRGTLKYLDRKVEIENKVIDYIKSVYNKKYERLNKEYIDFSQVDLRDTKSNWLKYMKLSSNFSLKETIPLYDHYSNKAITKSILAGTWYDSIKKVKYNNLEIYSIYDSKTDDFKILNPEYIGLRINKNSSKVINLIEGGNSYSSHNLQIEIKKIFLKFPNHLMLNLDNITTKDVRFNRVKVELYKKESEGKLKLLYKEKKEIKEFNPNIPWSKTIFRKKTAYKVNFWLDINFDKDNFSTIYDKMMNNGNLDLRDFILKIKPINDKEVSLDYPTFEFNL